MSTLLIHVADRAAGWSVAADRLKLRQEKARRRVLVLSIAGALFAAVASQLPAASGDGWTLAHQTVAVSAAVLLAIATFLSMRFLGQNQTQAWVRARGAAEALKREAFRFAARAAPYDTADAAAAQARFKDECRRIEEAAEKVAHPADDPGRPGSSPRAMLSAAEYRTRRVHDQARNFYRPKAQGYRVTAARLRRVEFGLALAAVIVTALAGALGKRLQFGGVTFDIAALTAVLTTISAAILTHIEASRLDHLIDTYGATARRLEDLDLDFDAASQDPAAWSRFVNRCEDIIAAENASWVAKWAETKAAS